MIERMWDKLRKCQVDIVTEHVEGPLDDVLDRNVNDDVESALLINVWDPIMDAARELRGAFDDTIQ